MTAYRDLKYVMLLCPDTNIAVIIKLGFSILKFLSPAIYTLTLTIIITYILKHINQATTVPLW